MKAAIVFLLGTVAGFVLAKELNISSRYISLANIRRGVENEWYTLDYISGSGFNGYYVKLTGKETDGEITSSWYEVSKSTWETLKNEGVALYYPTGADA